MRPGAAVVVTGAGSGIGAALARRFAADGARVVVNDLDAGAASAVAAEIGGHAVPGDVGSAAFTAELVAAAYDLAGGCDLFCANAGVAPHGGADAADADWARAWQVNVLSHVYAARALLPRWLDAGGGRLLVTVSAAGLLTMLGSAPYAVSKHAALAFAEWLRATYAHRGVVVQALCPQGVRTPMLDGAGEVGEALMGATAITAGEAAEAVARALDGDEFLILPHPEVGDWYRHRAADPDRWLAGMNRLQQGLEAR